MKKFLLTAAVVLLSTTAFAEKFNVGIKGGNAQIEIPKNCRSLSCLNFSYKDKDGKVYTKDDMKDLGGKKDGKVTEEPVTSPFSSNANTQPATPAPAPVAAPAPAPKSEPQQSVSEATNPRQPDIISAPVRVDANPPAREPERVAAVQAEPAPAPAPTPVTEVKAAPTGPIGEWLVEDGRAQIRIEACGSNLCGYVSHAKNPNDTDKKNPNPALRSRSIIGLPILIDMKPTKDNRWDGKIYNSENGSSYTSNIAMKNPNTLRVQGCAMGGLFCGGQNWKRVL